MAVIYGALAMAGVDIAHLRRHYTEAVHSELRAAGLLVGEPSEEQIELAARAMWRQANKKEAWEQVPESIQTFLRERASEVLAAAGVTPHTPSEAMDALYRDAFPNLAALSPDREKLVESIAGGTISVPGGYGEFARDDAENIVDALLPALVAAVLDPFKGAELESGETERVSATRIELRDTAYRALREAREPLSECTRLASIISSRQFGELQEGSR